MPDTNIEVKFLKTSSILALLSLVPALIALLGILTSHPLLQNYRADLPTMNLETIIGVCLIALSILGFNLNALKYSENDGHLARQAKIVLFLLGLMYGFTLAFYTVYYLLGIKDIAGLSSYLSSVRTSISFLAIGATIYTTTLRPSWLNLSLFFLLLPFYLALVVLTGHVIHASRYYAEIKGIGMSAPTSLAAILLVFATATGPARRVGAGYFLYPGLGGKLLRRLLPIALLLPPLFTWINLLLQRANFYSIEISTILQVVVPCFFLSSAIVWMTHKLTLSEREIEYRKEKQENLEDLNRAKDEFLYTLSHELRTPMNSILGFLELLPEYDSASNEYKKMLLTIERNARSEMHLIKSILEVSQLVTDKITLEKIPFDLRTTLESVFFSFKNDFESKHQLASLNVDDCPTSYTGDEERIRQILSNLIANAIKFTPEKGQINVTIERIDSSMHIIVEDTGIGIAQKHIAKIFESFWQADSSRTRKYNGLGIGLTLANHLAKAHGGYILAESDGIGKGAKFTLALPYS